MRINFIQKFIDKIRGKKITDCKFGKNTKIMKSARIIGSCEIGKYTYIGFNTCITEAKIGNYCSIGDNVIIGPSEHNINSISTSSHLYDGDNLYNEYTQKDVIIKNDVWLGSHSIIRRGVVIGNGAVIGANSFVNKDVPDYAVVAGSPAKIIKYRFDEDTIIKLLDLKWWEHDLADARNIIKDFVRVIELFEEVAK